MFESLQERLGSILNGLTGRGSLSEADVSAALREVRRALIEADVALDVVRSFTDRVRTKAVGAGHMRAITPAAASINPSIRCRMTGRAVVLLKARIPS